MSILFPHSTGLSRGIPSMFSKMADSGRETLQVQNIKCSYCDKTGRFMKLCTQCRAVLYCSRECQIKDWLSHKENCSSVKKKTDGNTSLQAPLSQSENIQEKEKVNERSSSNGANNEKKLEQPMGYSQNMDKKQEIFLNNEKPLSLNSQKKDSAKKKSTSTTDINLNSITSITSDENQRTSQMNGDVITIFIKHNREKKKIEILMTPKDKKSAFQQISDFLRIPAVKLKLIHKGTLVVPENVNSFLTHGALILAFGEVRECEDGLDETDIDILIKQLNVDRNIAVKALRKTGTLIDAIFDIGNKL